MSVHMDPMKAHMDLLSADKMENKAFDYLQGSYEHSKNDIIIHRSWFNHYEKCMSDHRII